MSTYRFSRQRSWGASLHRLRGGRHGPRLSEDEAVVPLHRSAGNDTTSTPAVLDNNAIASARKPVLSGPNRNISGLQNLVRSLFAEPARGGTSSSRAWWGERAQDPGTGR